jgi:hypothetical protein
MADRFPTADQVATAIVAACRETGAGDNLLAAAVAVATGEIKGQQWGGYIISRARYYAALALDDVFDEAGPVAIARVAGVKVASSQKSYVRVLRDRLRIGWAKWFDKAVLARVVAAVRACPAGPRPPQPPGGNGQRAPVQAAPRQVVRVIPEHDLAAKAPAVTPAMRTAAAAFTCAKCGQPKSSLSAKLCSNCFRGLTPNNRSAAPDVATRARQVERVIEEPDRFAGLGAQEYVPAPAGKRALQEMLANAAAETARLQKRVKFTDE